MILITHDLSVVADSRRVPTVMYAGRLVEMHSRQIFYDPQFHLGAAPVREHPAGEVTQIEGQPRFLIDPPDRLPLPVTAAPTPSTSAGWNRTWSAR